MSEYIVMWLSKGVAEVIESIAAVVIFLIVFFIVAWLSRK